MVCNKCGANVPEEAGFCPQCGASDFAAVQNPIENQNAGATSATTTAATTAADSVAAVAEKLKGNKMLPIIIAGVAAVVVIIAVIALIAANAGGAGFTIRENGYLYVEDDAEEYHYFYNGNELNKSIDKFSASISADGTAIYTITNDGELYYCSGTDMKKVADDVEYSVLSGNGKTLAYLSDNALYIYSGSAKKIAELDDDEQLSFIRVSPDGSAIVYSVYSYEDFKAKYKCYGWNGGEPVKLGTFYDGYVSNGGKIVYGISDNDKLYIVKNFDDSTKDSLGSCDEVLGLSENLDTICFYSDGKCRVYNTSFDSAKSFSAYNASVLNPIDRVYIEGCAVISDYKNFVVYSDNKLILAQLKKGEYEKITLAKNVDAHRISADGKTLIYKKNDNLYRISALKTQDEPELLAEDIRSFDANPDLSAIYYINDDRELMYAKGNGKSVKVESDYPDEYDVLHNGVCVYVIDDTIKYSTGDSGVKCTGIGECEEVSSYYSYYMLDSVNAVVAYSDDYVYISKDGKKFTKTNIEYYN